MTRAHYNLLVTVRALVRFLPRVDLAVSVERARVRQHLAAVLALNTRLAIGTNLSRPEKYLVKEKIFGIAKFSRFRTRQTMIIFNSLTLYFLLMRQRRCHVSLVPLNHTDLAIMKVN